MPRSFGGEIKPLHGFQWTRRAIVLQKTIDTE
jgi:hypothetical protein